MGMVVGSKKGALADMNVVPLIDILLVLLIIFMVINPNKPKGLDALVPQPARPDISSTGPVNPVVVQVLQDGRLKINEESFSWDALGPRLPEIFKARAERVAFIKGDEGVPFEVIARAIDLMRSANIDHVGLMTPKLESGS
jgi:biopolymer transport protein TolR